MRERPGSNLCLYDPRPYARRLCSEAAIRACGVASRAIDPRHIGKLQLARISSRDASTSIRGLLLQQRSAKLEFEQYLFHRESSLLVIPRSNSWVCVSATFFEALWDSVEDFPSCKINCFNARIRQRQVRNIRFWGFPTICNTGGWSGVRANKQNAHCAFTNLLKKVSQPLMNLTPCLLDRRSSCVWTLSTGWCSRRLLSKSVASWFSAHKIQFWRQNLECV